MPNAIRSNRRALRLIMASVIAVAVGACADGGEPSLISPDIAFSHKPGHGGGPGGGPPSPNPRVDATIHDGFSISNDGGGAYVNGMCGVVGQIWEGGTEDVTVTPAAEWDSGSGCPERYFIVDLTEGVDGEDFGVGTLSIVGVGGVNVAAPDDGMWHAVPVQFHGDVCKRVRFDAGDTEWTHVNPNAPWTSDNMRAMRIAHPIDPSKRAWRVETAPPDSDGTRHDRATCFHNANGNKRVLDGFFRITFAATIVEQ